MSDIKRAREEYLSKLTEEERAITLALWAEKSRQARVENKEARERVNSLAEIVKNLGENAYVTLDDGSDISINEKCAAVAYANMIRNPRTSFKDLNDLQKVIKDDTDDGKTSGIVVNFITNGQDLGE
jgi:hypothetical protein